MTLKAQYKSQIFTVKFTRKIIYPSEDKFRKIKVKEADGTDTLEAQHVILQRDQTVAAETSNALTQDSSPSLFWEDRR